MTLGTKTSLFVLLGVASLALALNLGTRLLVISGLEDAELQETVEKVEAARDILATMAGEFSERANDWADWDDMATYLDDGNAAFEESNHDHDSFASIGWDLYMVVKADGTERATLFRDRAKGAFVPLPAGLRAYVPRLLVGAGAHAAPIHGVVVAEGKRWLVSSRAIRKTDKTPGPTAGRLITARMIDDPWIARLRNFTFLDVGLERLEAAPAGLLETQARAALAKRSAPYVQKAGDAELRGYTTVDDIAGSAALLMRIDRPRKLEAHGQTILDGTLAMVALAGLLLVAAALWAMRRNVLRPLASLQDGVRALQSGRSDARVSVRGAAEFETLGTAFNAMAEAIEAREAALRAANARTRLVLDTTGDALIGCTLDGALLGDSSAAAVAWFGEPAGAVWDYLLEPDDHRTRASMASGFDQIAMDFLPFDLLIDQLPVRFTRAGRTFGLTYRRIVADGEPDQLLVIVRDQSARVEAERAEREARELHIIVSHFMRDPDDVARFLAEGERLLERLASDAPLDVRKRDLHTLKGNSAIMGFLGFSDACHALEDELAEEPTALAPPRVAQLAAEWRETRDRVAALAPAEADRHVSMTTDEHLRFLTLLHRREDHARLATYARAWTFPSAQRAFSRLESQVGRIATSLGKSVRFGLAETDVRVNVAQLEPFMDSLVHVARNAIDHGLEPAAVRAQLGKQSIGTVSVDARVEADRFIVALADDGAGIAWERVASKARALGLPAESHADLEAALFTDGFSTRDSVTSLSGRGVGLAAVKAAVCALGGHIAVASAPGHGTTFRFELPLWRGDVKLAWIPPLRVVA